MTGESYETPNDYFVDDGTAEPHEPNINAAAASALAVGDGQDVYDPIRMVSRSQMAGFLTRALVALEDGGLITLQDGTAAASRTSNTAGGVIPCNGGRCDGTDDSDTLVAGNSAEAALTGGPGNDRLEGGPGNDSLNGIFDDDVLVGGTGDDLLRDASPMDTDRLFGGRGNDTLDARDADSGDLVDGGPGDDDCSGDQDDTFVSCERVTRL